MLIFKCIITYKTKPATFISVIEDDNGIRSDDGSNLNKGDLSWLPDIRQISQLFAIMGFDYLGYEKQYTKDVTDVVYSISLIEDSQLIDNNNINQLSVKEIQKIANIISNHHQFINLFHDDNSSKSPEPSIKSSATTNYMNPNTLSVEEPILDQIHHEDTNSDLVIEEPVQEDYAGSCVTGDDTQSPDILAASEKLSSVPPLLPLEIDIPPSSGKSVNESCATGESDVVIESEESAAIAKPKKSRKSKKSTE